MLEVELQIFLKEGFVKFQAINYYVINKGYFMLKYYKVIREYLIHTY